VEELTGDLVLDSGKLFNGLLTSFSSLVELDCLLLFLNAEGNRVLDKAQLKPRAGPGLLLKDDRQRIGHVLGPTLERDLKEGSKSLGVEVQVVLKLAQSLEDLLPVKMGEELPESAHKIVNAPCHLVLLVDNLLAEQGAIALFVRFECVLSNASDLVIESRVVDGEVQKSSRHGLLINVLEVLKNLEEVVVVVGREVTQVNQELPRLEHLVALVQVVNAIALLEQTDTRLFLGNV